jgi:hypothetical protein
MTAAPPALAADLNDGLKRLKMAAMRRLAPELLITAKTQRWNPEEFLRTPGRGRDRRPGRLQRTHPTPPSRIPRHQDPR